MYKLKKEARPKRNICTGYLKTRKVSNMYLVGIDPGASGAICILNKDGSIHSVEDMPLIITKTETRKKAPKGSKTKTVKTVKESKEVDAKTLSTIIPEASITLLEKVGAMPGQGVTSMFSFGETYGSIKSIASIKSEKLLLVRPNEWQKYFGLTMSKKDKEGMSKGEVTKLHKSNIANKVLELYPDAREALTGPRGGLKDGRADAIMIARYLFEALYTKEDLFNG